MSDKTRVVNISKSGDLRKDCDVYIGRPSQWGNPFIMGPDGSREEVIAQHKRWILEQPKLLSKIHTLRGKRLGCFCKPLTCHGDTLKELADEG